MSDFVQRFLFEDLDLRGALVRLGPAWQSMQQGRHYPAAVSRLLGEMTATAVLIAGNLKQEGRLTLQIAGQGDVRLLVVDCSQELQIRGMARSAPSDPLSSAKPDLGGVFSAETTLDISRLIGNGHLQLSLDMPQLREPYRSLVPLDGSSISEIFEHYLHQSEQTPSSLILTANADGVAGLFLQKLPGADARDADGWARITQLAATLRPEELQQLPTETLLQRLFAEEDLRLFPPRSVSHHCPYDLDKVRRMLFGLGRAEAEAALAEQGEIVIHDEICNHTYRFTAADIAALFADPPAQIH